MTWADGSDSEFELHNDAVIRRNRQRRHLEAMGLPPGSFGRHGLEYRRRKFRRWYVKQKALALGITVEHAEKITRRMPYRPRPNAHGVRRSLISTTAGSTR